MIIYIKFVLFQKYFNAYYQYFKFVLWVSLGILHKLKYLSK